MRALNKTIFLYLIHLNLLPAIVLAQKGDVADSILQVATKLYQEDRELKLALSPALKAYLTSLSSKNKITELNSLHLICIIQWEEGLLKKAEETAIKGLTKAGEYQNDTLRGSFLVMRGLISYSHSNYQQALGQYKLALAYFQAAKKTKNLATAYCNMV
ncbi:hypothetical protein [Arcticibacter sp. MXS-1]|uniref:hypothetical protein n=1 Tax=Arcticibacter sp. MXS-1 TaxID=3341726 RepID=UPI0035A822ED